ncbi:MAG: hypothetical protein WAK55_22880 [Xanthobacteraceae bacterium]
MTRLNWYKRAFDFKPKLALKDEKRFSKADPATRFIKCAERSLRRHEHRNKARDLKRRAGVDRRARASGNCASQEKPPFRPVGIYVFVDKTQVWLARRLSIEQLKWLKVECESGGGSLHVKNNTAWFNPQLKQRLQLNQPTDAALQFLEMLDGLHLNYVELSLDWTFVREDERNEAYDFLCRYHVKNYHRDQGIRWVGERGETRYTGPRGAANVLAIYRDRPSKMTGEVNCLHLDWRMRGPVALCRAGITSIQQLRKIDHRAFWQKRLVMARLIAKKLGRQYHVHVARKGPRRKPWVIFIGSRRFPYHVDERMGATIIRSLGSTQAVLDAYRSYFNVRSCLQRMSVEHLLPKRGAL